MSRKLFHLFPSFGFGGSQVRLAQICNHFGDRYSHTFYATDGYYDVMSLLGSHVPVRKLDVSIDKTRGLLNLPIYARILREIEPDVVVTHNWGTVEWAFAMRLRGKPQHVHIEDGFGPDEVSRQLPRRVFFRRMALAGRHTSVVVPSRVLYGIATTVWKLPPGKVRVIPNGIDLRRFAAVTPADAGVAVGKVDGEVLVGTVASLRPEKNLTLLIEAFARLPQAPPTRLFIVGSGTETARLQRRIQELNLGDRVVLFGHTPAPEQVMRAFDIFAMSSNTEQMPISLLEAMASGLPVVATDVGDITHMVASENRPFVTPAGALDPLAQGLARLVQDRALRTRIGALNLAKATAEYDQTLMFQRYAKLFDQADVSTA